MHVNGGRDELVDVTVDVDEMNESREIVVVGCHCDVSLSTNVEVATKVTQLANRRVPNVHHCSSFAFRVLPCGVGGTNAARVDENNGEEIFYTFHARLDSTLHPVMYVLVIARSRPYEGLDSL